MKSLVILEHDQNSLCEGMAEILNAAYLLGSPVDVLIAGSSCEKAAQEASRFSHIEHVITVEHSILNGFLAEPMVDAALSLIEDYSTLILPASRFGKNIAPRLASILDWAMISDIIQIHSNTSFERPVYAGNITQTLDILGQQRVLTFRSTEFTPLEQGGSASITKHIWKPGNISLSRFVQSLVSEDTGINLASAQKVVAFGRSIGSKDNVEKIIKPLAEVLGAAIGATRSAVDEGFSPNEWQIGQSGTIVAPDLYIAIGLSGAAQHLSGMKGSRIIVAINQDETAPIMQLADYALVGDLFTLIPELTALLKK